MYSLFMVAPGAGEGGGGAGGLSEGRGGAVWQSAGETFLLSLSRKR